jgi:hypothetical protein
MTSNQSYPICSATPALSGLTGTMGGTAYGTRWDILGQLAADCGRRLSGFSGILGGSDFLHLQRVIEIIEAVYIL